MAADGLLRDYSLSLSRSSTSLGKLPFSNGTQMDEFWHGLFLHHFLHLPSLSLCVCLPRLFIIVR